MPNNSLYSSWIAASLLLATALNEAAIPRFQDVHSQAGLDVMLTSGDDQKRFLVESVGGGIGIIDYDRDGWMDIFVVNGTTIEGFRTGVGASFRNRLYRNNGDLTFSDVTEKAGLGDPGWGKGVLVADLDNDGYDDIYVCNYGPNLLYRNRGNGTFEELGQSSGLSDASWSSAAAAADFDGDGDLDVFLANYLDYDIHNLPVSGKFCSYREIPVACGPRGLAGASDKLFRNDGNWRFTEVSRKAGVSDEDKYYGLGAVWGDYDNDGDPDLYVANDSTPNYLYRNEGSGRFSEVGAVSGTAYSDDGREQAGMGVDFEDYDNDGWMDLVVTNFSHDYNTIYRNLGNGLFSDVSYTTGLAADSTLDLSWGVGFRDFNNDGRKDLFIANGHIYPQLENFGLDLSFRQQNKLYINDGSGHFINVSNRAGPALLDVKSSRGTAFGDFDNNGTIDLVVSELDDQPSLLVNHLEQENYWVRFFLEGSVSNRNAVGARVILTTGGSTQMAEVKAGGSYASSNEFTLHFGLGLNGRADRVEIRWPSGKVTRMDDVPANQVLRIREPGDSEGDLP